MLVAMLATVAGAESVKKKTIKAVVPKAQQTQNVILSDFDNAINAFFNDDYNTAFTAINNHLKKNSNDPFGWTCLAAIQGECDNDAEALKAIKKARECKITQNDPNMLNWMYFTQSSVYLQLKDTTNAIEALNKAIKSVPEDVDSYMRLGNIYKKMREYDLAMVNYGLAVQHNPKEVEGYLGLGTVAGSLGKRKDSIKAYTMAIKLEPDVAESYALRAVEYYNDWDYKNAAKDVISALELDRENARALWILEYLKQEPDAAKDLQKEFKNKAKKSKDNTWLNFIVG